MNSTTAELLFNLHEHTGIWLECQRHRDSDLASFASGLLLRMIWDG